MAIPYLNSKCSSQESFENLEVVRSFGISWRDRRNVKCVGVTKMCHAHESPRMQET